MALHPPDLTVIRGQPELDTLTSGPDYGDTVVNPTLLLIVLSPATESYDRSTKFEYLRRHPAVREYVLVWADDPRVESFDRQSDGVWRFRCVVGLDRTIRLDSLGIDLPLAEVFAGVMFPPPDPADAAD